MSSVNYIDNVINTAALSFGFERSCGNYSRIIAPDIHCHIVVEKGRMISRQIFIALEHTAATTFARRLCHSLSGEGYLIGNYERASVFFLIQAIERFNSSELKVIHISDPLDQVAFQLNLLEDVLQSNIVTIKDSLDYERVLAEDDLPFLWSQINPVGRYAELYFLVRKRGGDIQQSLNLVDDLVSRDRFFIKEISSSELLQKMSFMYGK